MWQSWNLNILVNHPGLTVTVDTQICSLTCPFEFGLNKCCAIWMFMRWWLHDGGLFFATSCRAVPWGEPYAWPFPTPQSLHRQGDAVKKSAGQGPCSVVNAYTLYTNDCIQMTVILHLILKLARFGQIDTSTSSLAARFGQIDTSTSSLAALHVYWLSQEGGHHGAMQASKI
jgi:hypothetical protein